MRNTIIRGDLYYADLNPVMGSEQGGIRPVLVVQNNVGNQYSPTIIVAAITGRVAAKPALPTHHLLSAESNLGKQSIILLEQIRTVDKRRLKDYVGTLGLDDMQAVDRALEISLGLIGEGY